MNFLLKQILLTLISLTLMMPCLAEKAPMVQVISHNMAGTVCRAYVADKKLETISDLPLVKYYLSQYLENLKPFNNGDGLKVLVIHLQELCELKFFESRKGNAANLNSFYEIIRTVLDTLLHEWSCKTVAVMNALVSYACVRDGIFVDSYGQTSGEKLSQNNMTNRWNSDFLTMIFKKLKPSMQALILSKGSSVYGIGFKANKNDSNSYLWISGANLHLSAIDQNDRDDQFQKAYESLLKIHASLLETSSKLPGAFNYYFSFLAGDFNSRSYEEKKPFFSDKQFYINPPLPGTKIVRNSNEWDEMDNSQKFGLCLLFQKYWARGQYNIPKSMYNHEEFTSSTLFSFLKACLDIYKLFRESSEQFNKLSVMKLLDKVERPQILKEASVDLIEPKMGIDLPTYCYSRLGPTTKPANDDPLKSKIQELATSIINKQTIEDVINIVSAEGEESKLIHSEGDVSFRTLFNLVEETESQEMTTVKVTAEITKKLSSTCAVDKIPSWCDRLMYLNSRLLGSQLTDLTYYSNYGLRFSDHVPLFLKATFTTVADLSDVKPLTDDIEMEMVNRLFKYRAWQKAALKEEPSEEKDKYRARCYESVMKKVKEEIKSVVTLAKIITDLGRTETGSLNDEEKDMVAFFRYLSNLISIDDIYLKIEKTINENYTYDSCSHINETGVDFDKDHWKNPPASFSLANGGKSEVKVNSDHLKVFIKNINEQILRANDKLFDQNTDFQIDPQVLERNVKDYDDTIVNLYEDNLSDDEKKNPDQSYNTVTVNPVEGTLDRSGDETPYVPFIEELLSGTKFKPEFDLLSRDSIVKFVLTKAQSKTIRNNDKIWSSFLFKTRGITRKLI